ncbi:MAG: secretin and TonB N-terminal domain-containing protein [Candidatus Omnitrophica bacterium]|nr:secretin and TonB N-terminal domain-containing protein [Candidatus Omnitrophota bacterium]
MNHSRLRIVSMWVFGILMIVMGSFTADTADHAYAEAKSENVTINVKDTEIGRVLDAFSQQTGLSVVVGKEVTGAISVRLLDVSWDRALDAILKPYGFGYERSGDVIVVLPLAKIQELNESQPLTSRVFKLRYLDAGDIAPVIEAQISSRGKIQVVEETGQKGWDFGAFGAAGGSAQTYRSGTGSSAGGGGMARRSYKGSADRRSKSKRIVVTDIPSVLDRVEEVLKSLDIMPQQVLIEARFMEVNRDRLKDLGVDIATGTTSTIGTSTAAVETVIADETSAGKTTLKAGGQNLGSLAAPAAFAAKATGITKVNPFNTGLSLALQKLTDPQFDVLIHALEEDIHTNTLSAPSIVTLDNQEANILVGTQYPILTSSVAGTTSTTTVSSLDYYQDIGIQLRVVPQIAADDHINMIVHPAVTSFSSTLASKSATGETLAEYPIITTREAETQILMRNGETIVIGGLLKDVKTAGYHRIPILGYIPLLGIPFQRRTDDVEKIDLLIFITARIVTENEVATQTPVFSPDKPGSKTKIEWKKEHSQEEPEEMESEESTSQEESVPVPVSSVPPQEVTTSVSVEEESVAEATPAAEEMAVAEETGNKGYVWKSSNVAE